MTGEFSFNRDTFFEKNNSNKGKFLPQIVATFFYLWLLLFEDALTGHMLNVYLKSLIRKVNFIVRKNNLN
ncbi:hypothetical protein BpHYR1_012889 [Brachionus plicatilis]|uniref:Uncharacterized protein n=1 Tax=Brachionus plicatilis TaxID=10195 RepID=A0A3M7Q6U5_BRAPC|nr:hypothetical protein BpHYR1_012889 [Brachionus plicatilis]